jgi:urea transport system ATP-binding protein
MASSTDFLLALESVSVSFDGFKAVNDLNLYIDYGELRVIIGPNGAGKTTVLDLICGRTRVSDGSIKFKDQEITGCKEQEIVRRGIGRKFQTPTIYEDLTVFENLELSLPRRVEASPVRCSGIATRRSSSASVRSPPWSILVKRSSIGARNTLSHGQKQWLEVGMLLIQDPELLMLDEPVAGMSVSRARERTAELLKRDRPGALGDRGRARHEIRGEHRRSGDRPAPRQGLVGRRRCGIGQERSRSDRGLSRPLI